MSKDMRPSSNAHDSHMTTLSCPTCQRPVQWRDSFPFKPFCSERCKLIDLGAWASEQYGIAADTPPDQDF